MSNLLSVIRFNTENVKSPIVAEIPVDPETKPFIATNSKGLVWVEKAVKDSIRAVIINNKTPGQLFSEIVSMVADRSVRESWGSVAPFSKEGFESAKSYLDSFGLSDIEMLVNPKTRASWLMNTDLPLRIAGWVEKNQVVVVPRDRDFVGIIGHFDGKNVVVVAHNPSRGIVVLK